MSNITPIKQVSISSNVVRDYTGSQLQLIKNTVAADTTPDEFDMFVEVCKNMRLDPFRKQLYCIVYNKDKPKYRKVAFITGIDGFRAIAERNGDYRPDDAAPVFDTDPSLKDKLNPHGLVSATVKAFKQDRNGDWFPIVGIVYWDEFAPVKDVWKNGQKTDEKELSGNWKTMPRVMLAKCAEAVALRKGWPEDLSGIHSSEEMEVVNTEHSATEEIEKFEAEERQRKIGGNKSIMFSFAAGDPLEPVEVGKVFDKCAEFVNLSESPTEIEAWGRTNKESLKQFWAADKNAMLELKKIIEKRITALSEAA